MTPAEERRAAAKLMRDRASQAAGYSPGPWVSDSAEFGELSVITTADVPEWRVARCLTSAAEHIAGMHPGVALAVADWLDEVAADRHSSLPEWVEAAALAIARAYLGETP